MEKHILKKLAWLYMACAMVMPVVVLTGCSDDDDDDDGGNATASSMTEVTGFTGTDGSNLYLTNYNESWYGITMVYDEDNNYMLTSFGEDDWMLEITSESPLKYEFSYYDEDFDETITETYSNFNTNSSGYLTSLKYSYVDDEEDYYWNDYITFSFSYNSKGQLTEMKYSETESDKDYEDGWTYSWKETSTTTFTWEDDRITTVYETSDYTEKDSEDGTESGTWDITYTFSYDTEYENATLQYPVAVFEDIFYYNEPFSFIGWCGIGPAYLPSSYTYVETEPNFHTL